MPVSYITHSADKPIFGSVSINDQCRISDALGAEIRGEDGLAALQCRP